MPGGMAHGIGPEGPYTGYPGGPVKAPLTQGPRPQQGAPGIYRGITREP